MSPEPSVSVIIIFYNSRPFLAEAIESVLFQTEQSWELILADDGSTDGSTTIALEYSGRCCERIRYVEHEGHRNRGMSPTRNLGVRHSRGKWVAFLDSDDVWSANKLEEQLELLQSHPEAGMLYGSPLYWSSWADGITGALDRQPGISVPPGALVHPPELMTINYPLGTGAAPCPSDLILARTVFDSVGGFEESFDGMYQMYEDQAFLAKVYRTTPVLVSGSCWTKYRQHSSACTSTVQKAGQYDEVRRFFLEYLEGYLRKCNEGNPAIWRALKRAWWPYRHPVLANMRSFTSRFLNSF